MLQMIKTMNIQEAQTLLEKLTNSKISQSEIARALGKDRSNINAKAKRGTELKLSEVNLLENYFGVNLSTKQQRFSQNDLDDLKDIIYIIEEFLNTKKLKLTPDKKSELIVTIYKLYLNGDLKNIKKDNVISFCKLVA